MATDSKSTKKDADETEEDEEAVEDDTVYEVEAIVDHKGTNKSRRFLIKWQGYPESDNSWEPRENINAEMVKEYEANLKKWEKIIVVFIWIITHQISQMLKKTVFSFLFFHFIYSNYYFCNYQSKMTYKCQE